MAWSVYGKNIFETLIRNGIQTGPHPLHNHKTYTSFLPPVKISVAMYTLYNVIQPTLAEKFYE